MIKIFLDNCNKIFYNIIVNKNRKRVNTHEE